VNFSSRGPIFNAPFFQRKENSVRPSIPTSPASSHLSLSGLPALKTILSLPLLYGMSIPLIFLDLALSLYHMIVFPLLGLKPVPRRHYIRIDRHRLSYLPWELKIGCVYCGYANGLLQFACRIAGETERHFCPSKHRETPEFFPPPHHKHFAEFGDAEGFAQRFLKRRDKS